MPDTEAKLKYQVSPIFLTGGLAAQLGTGAILPLMWLTNRQGDPTHAYNFNVMGLPPLAIIDFDDVFGSFNVVPGGTLVAQEIAKHPFANQGVAANATIREPLTISVYMDTPMRVTRTFGGQNVGPGGVLNPTGPSSSPNMNTTTDPWATKLSIMSALKATLDAHNNAGGLYTIYTPAYMYVNVIMKSLTDASRIVSPNNIIPQNSWKFDFEKPLVSLEDLTQAYQLNYMMVQLSKGVPATTLAITGPQVGVQTGQSPLLFPSLTQTGVAGMITATGLGTGNIPILTTTSTYNTALTATTTSISGIS